MRWPTITTVKMYTRIFLFLLFSVIQIKVHAWEVDLSRRKSDIQKANDRFPASELVPIASSGAYNTFDSTGNAILVKDEDVTQANTTAGGAYANAGTVVAQPKAGTGSTGKSLLSKVFQEISSPSQTLVILNTENGFVPDQLRLKKGVNYRIHVVNVNEKEKNVSFVLDAFSEHHATYFGKQKTFEISPKTEGIFSYQCPETAKQGRIVIYGDERTPASE